MVKRKWLHRESLFAMRCDTMRCDGWMGGVEGRGTCQLCFRLVVSLQQVCGCKSKLCV